MAKMTISGLKSFVTSYVDASKQAGTWSDSTSSFTNLVDKIGKQVTIDGNFNDKLPMLDGENLPLGKTIEEYMVDLTLPVAYDSDGHDTFAPHRPTFESCAYSYDLGRKVIPTTYSYDQIEQGCRDAATAGNIAADIMLKFAQSQTLYTYYLKKQLLANVIAKASAVGAPEGLVEKVTPLAGEGGISAEEACEEFIQKIKDSVEDASFANEGHCLSSTLIGAAPELTLFVKKGVMPSLQVKALAGAFQKEELALPARVVVVDDFGNADNKWIAMLVDTRGIKLHESYKAVREQLNAEGDFINYFAHSQYTGFISKNTYVKVFKDAN